MHRCKIRGPREKSNCVSNALWMFFIDKRKVISKVFIFAFQPRWKSGVRPSETLRRKMTSDAPRRRRNRRRRADERTRAMRTLSGISSVARRDRSRDRSRVDSRRRTTRPVAKDPPDDGGLSHQPRFTADVASSSFSLPFRPKETNAKTKQKESSPFPERTHPSVVRAHTLSRLPSKPESPKP